jgi:type IV secretion system protein VirB9
MKRILLAFGLLSSIGSIHALELPTKSNDDHRIRTVTYNRNDVVQLDTMVGVSTHIELEPGEQYLTHVFGDSRAYAFTKAKNHIFIKPIVEDSNTNLIIVTDRRTYNFRLSYIGDRSKESVYDLSFSYPDTVAKEQAEKKKQSDIDAAFRQQRGRTNLKYSMSGDLEIAPVNVWDIGDVTYFKFPGNVDLPLIYEVDAKGDEHVIPKSIVGPAHNIWAVQKVNAKWSVRLGAESVLTVWNDAFDPLGVENISRTLSPSVQRVIKVQGDSQ